ncbi:MAG: TIM barrel protein [Firmicutes bacterium]|nr:TIM barrel protein [Bacillota bacterium]
MDSITDFFDDMNDRIFIATFSKGAIGVAKEFGLGLEINDLCISSNLNPENREWVIARIKKEIAAVYGEEWFTEDKSVRRKVFFHGPFTELTPAAIDNRAIALIEERYRETLDIADEFGIKDIVLHDGYIPLMYQKSWHIKKSVDFWNQFLDSVSESYTFYIENVFDDEPYMLTEIVDEVCRKNFKICLDVGHANCMTKGIAVEDWMSTMGNRIGHLHLHNNDGSGDQHNAFSEGSLDMASLLKVCVPNCCKNATLTIESRDAIQDAKFFQKLL